MILGLCINLTSNSFIESHEFDNRFWQMIPMQWETINDTWEEEI